MRAIAIWMGLGLAVVVPVVLAATSPQLAWRQPVYIIAGFAGVVSLGLLLVQPLLAAAALPGLPRKQSRTVHRWLGLALVAAVIVHVGGLWIFSPPDVIDVLLFRSPTPFSVWGVMAMWAVFAAAVLAAFRHRLKPLSWSVVHTILVTIVVLGTAIHAVLIQGTMEVFTKWALCILVVLATLKGLSASLLWKRLRATRK